VDQLNKPFTFIISLASLIITHLHFPNFHPKAIIQKMLYYHSILIVITVLIIIHHSFNLSFKLRQLNLIQTFVNSTAQQF
jgi:hypothetical protein